MPGAAPSYAPDLALEPKHIQIQMAFDVDAKTAAGTVTTTIRANRAGARSIKLNAISFEDVSVAGPDSWRYDGEFLHATWNKGFDKDEQRTLAVTYRVVDPVSGLFFRGPDDHYPQRERLCWTDHETERARYWLPCVDYPTVRTTLSFDLTGPAGMTILANGKLIESGPGMAKWQLEQPCPSYLCCIVLGDMVTYEDETVDGVTIAYFASKQFQPDHLHKAFGNTPAMMRWLTERLRRPFPYPKYFQAALPGLGGAMENISLVTWDAIFMCDQTLKDEWGDLVDAINIHEMAHSYFGDDVVCRHFEHAWLKESWAVYIETAYWEENVGRDEADYDFFRNARSYIDEADNQYVRPIVTRTYNSSWDLFDRHLYPGGACRLHMLRHAVGTETFWDATADYVATYSGRVVETADFRQMMEKHSGLNLNRFFDQWIYGKGYPKLKVTFSHDAEKNQATLTIEQTQVDEKTGVGLFDLDLEITLEDENGWTTRTVAVHDQRHVVMLSTKGKPTQIRIDPETKVLFGLEFHPGFDMLNKTMREAPDIVSRIRAAETLIDKGTRKGIAAVREAMQKEPYYGVREAVAKALAAAPSPGVAETLAAMLLDEKEPRIQRTLARACGAFRDERLRAALLTYLESATPPPFARAAALQALGAQRNPDDLERLHAATQKDDLHRLAAGGAWGGLAQYRSEETFAAFLPQVRYGVEDERSRRAVVMSLAASAKNQRREEKERAVDALIDLTRDPSSDIAMRAAAALAGLQAGRAASSIANVKRRVSEQEVVSLDRHLARLRSGPPGEAVGSLKKQVEKLEEKCRKFDERVQDLEAKHEDKKS